MPSILWFCTGCLLGVAACAAAAAVYFLLQDDASTDFLTRTPALPVIAVATVAAHVDAAEPSDANPNTKVCPDFVAVTPAWQTEHQHHVKVSSRVLTIPRSLRKRVKLWGEVWGRRNNRSYLLVDKRQPWVVHVKVDCRRLFKPGAELKQAEQHCSKRLNAAKKRLVKQLRSQRRKPRRTLLRDFAGSRSLAKSAYKNVLIIEGKRDSLAVALKRSQADLHAIEQVFAGQKVPPILSRLAIIESLFQADAVSPAGAVGAYQFVSNTARQYLIVDDAIDERLDPIRSSYAAALYLTSLNKRFKSWPLALTAYNTGPTRLRKLAKRFNTRDVGKIIAKGDSGNFGFDGQNYYAQFVAVAQLTAKSTAHAENIEFRYVTVPRPMALDAVVACLEQNRDAVVAANPAFTEALLSGAREIPEGYLLRLPVPQEPAPALAQGEDLGR